MVGGIMNERPPSCVDSVAGVISTLCSVVRPTEDGRKDAPSNPSIPRIRSPVILGLYHISKAI